VLKSIPGEKKYSTGLHLFGLALSTLTKYAKTYQMPCKQEKSAVLTQRAWQT